MPFTPSHAVVALPFLRTRLVPAAIAVGAMTPDLFLFLRLPKPLYALTREAHGLMHDLRALPLTMVVALGLLLMWRALLRPAIRALSPSWLAARLPEAWDASATDSVRETIPSARAVPWLFAALGIGVATHDVWDSFTHDSPWMQNGSTVIGLLGLGLVGAIWLRRRPPGPLPWRAPRWVRVSWWISLPALIVVALIAGVVQVYGIWGEEVTVEHLAYRTLPTACALWGAFTLVLCLVVARLTTTPGDPLPRAGGPGT